MYKVVYALTRSLAISLKTDDIALARIERDRLRNSHLLSFITTSDDLECRSSRVE